MAKKKTQGQKRLTIPKDASIFLPLQGGGSWGAETYGRLVYAAENTNLLEHVTAISGVSAGAVNGILVAAAIAEGKPENAVKYLDQFWGQVGKDGAHLGELTELFRQSTNHSAMIMSLLEQSMKPPTVRLLHPNTMVAAFSEKARAMTEAMSRRDVKWPNLAPEVAIAMESAARVSNTYGLMNQPNDIAKRIDAVIGDKWDLIRNSDLDITISACEMIDPKGPVHPSNMRLRNFKTHELCAEHIGASAALLNPMVIDGKRYWDGAYIVNPALDVFDPNKITDVVALTLSRFTGPIVPNKQDHYTLAKDQLRGSEVADELVLLKQRHPHIRWHVSKGDIPEHCNRTSKLNSHPRWLEELKLRGKDNAAQYFATTGRFIGHRNSFKPQISYFQPEELAPVALVG